LDAAFCFACRCFSVDITSHRGHSDPVFISNGFRGWNIATKKFKLHQMSSIHVSSVQTLSAYLKEIPIDVQLENKIIECLSKQEEKRINNRIIMKKLINIIITIANGGRALRGHDENSKSLEKGLFLEIVELISRYDPVMKRSFRKCSKKFNLSKSRYSK